MWGETLRHLYIAPDRPLCFHLQDLPGHLQDFGFIVGRERPIFRDQDPANIEASEFWARSVTRSMTQAFAATKGSNTSLAFMKSSPCRCLARPRNPDAGGKGDGRRD
jgi:hypothetical protein